MGRTGLALLLLGSLALLGSCSHATPQIVQVFSQTNRVFDPAEGSWSTRLSVFLQVSTTDGNKVFDRLHLIQDDRQLVYTLGASEWASVERPGEFWIGVNNLRPPEGTAATGTWRALVVTRSGQRVETTFAVPPVPSDAPPPLRRTVTVTAAAPGHVRFSGWADDSLIWFRGAKDEVIGRSKVVGPEAAVPPGTVSLELYSYDKARGEGIEAGPFPVQTAVKPADR